MKNIHVTKIKHNVYIKSSCHQFMAVFYGGEGAITLLESVFKELIICEILISNFLMWIILLRNQITRGYEYWIGLFVGSILSEKSNKTQA
jgi:hypothetical protein